jgi:Fe-S oxidoreductase
MPGNLPKKTARALLDIEDNKVVPVIRNPQSTTVDSEAVFYFPGCGSERLFSQVGLATQAMLWHAGVQTVLPPGYLCCGYPQRGSGQFDKAEKMMTDNRVLFHRVANTLNYLDIKTVVVSCGTCYDQLATYEFDKIFPGCRIVDIHEFLMEKNIRLEGVTGTRYVYHDPCHTPMKLQGPLKTVNTLISAVDGQAKIEKTDRCCGESGTLAVSRPDISTQVRFRKEIEMKKSADKVREDGFSGDVKVLTSCPACLQGLSRYNDDSGTQADYLVVEMARHLLGENWLVDYVERANQVELNAYWYKTMEQCELCRGSGEDVVIQCQWWRVILVNDPLYPGFCRVIWNAHKQEMSDLHEAEREELMRVVCNCAAQPESVSAAQNQSGQSGQYGAASALACDSAFRR